MALIAASIVCGNGPEGARVAVVTLPEAGPLLSGEGRLVRPPPLCPVGGEMETRQTRWLSGAIQKPPLSIKSPKLNLKDLLWKLGRCP